jgi:C1A family cysteine protease
VVQKIYNQSKTIKLLKITLSDKGKSLVKHNLKTALKNNYSKALFSSYLPSTIDLGMNHVPVLDQGMHGTCVTFAVSAALDALLGQGDFISQLCHLSLGNYIANNSTDRPSGWDGSDATITLSRFAEYGVVSKEQEKAKNGCGGISEYPVDSMTDPDNEMSLEAYHQASLNSKAFFEEGSDFFYHNLLNFQEVVTDKPDMTSIETKVKETLYHGNRVLIAVLVPLKEWLGLDGQYRKEHDTWILTGRTAYLANTAMSLFGLSNWGGHEMVITGYDDYAQVTDADGVTHYGLFILRNSWGSDVGDHGTFYMSYDYFRALTLDLVSIGNLSF